MTSVEAAPSHHRRPGSHDQVFAGRALPPGTERWSSLLDRNRAFLDGVDFRGDPGQVVRLPATDDIDMESVLLVGLGPTADNEALRRAAGWAARSAGGGSRRHRPAHRGNRGSGPGRHRGFLLGSYRFDRYRSRPKPPPPSRLVLSGADGAQLDESEAGKVVAEAVALRATWSSSRQPPNLPMTWRLGLPRSQPRREQRRGPRGEPDRRRGSRGSRQCRRRVHQGPAPGRIRHRPDGAVGSLALVKGITFDSGGLSIKTAEQMEPMKSDMAGAAAVVATLQAVAKLGLPLALEVITPLADNLPSGSAMKPGDVLLATGRRSRSHRRRGAARPGGCPRPGYRVGPGCGGGCGHAHGAARVALGEGRRDLGEPAVVAGRDRRRGQTAGDGLADAAPPRVPGADRLRSGRHEEHRGPFRRGHHRGFSFPSSSVTCLGRTSTSQGRLLADDEAPPAQGRIRLRGADVGRSLRARWRIGEVPANAGRNGARARPEPVDHASPGRGVGGVADLAALIVAIALGSWLVWHPLVVAGEARAGAFCVAHGRFLLRRRRPWLGDDGGPGWASPVPRTAGLRPLL